MYKNEMCKIFESLHIQNLHIAFFSSRFGRVVFFLFSKNQRIFSVEMFCWMHMVNFYLEKEGQELATPSFQLP